MERVVCKLCGWIMERVPEPVIAMPGDKVSTPRSERVLAKGGKKYVYRGTCHCCHREDVLLTSTIGTCHRCYYRNRHGIDPAAEKASRLTSPAQTADQPVVSASSSPGEEMAALVLTLAFTGDHLDIVQRFADLSEATGGTLVDDLCTIIDLYLDRKLQLRTPVGLKEAA